MRGRQRAFGALASAMVESARILVEGKDGSYRFIIGLDKRGKWRLALSCGRIKSGRRWLTTDDPKDLAKLRLASMAWCADECIALANDLAADLEPTKLFPGVKKKKKKKKKKEKEKEKEKEKVKVETKHAAGRKVAGK